MILGKTNVPVSLGDWQSYNEIYGTTNNPFDLGRTPGGSSGGSSAALAAGYGALSLGSDIGGSLRSPAHYCGIYAHKPTFALAPTRGHIAPPVPPLPFERDLSVIGPMARGAADLALLLDVIAGPDELEAGVGYRLALPPPRHTAFKDFRVLVLDDHPLLPVASEHPRSDRDPGRTAESRPARPSPAKVGYCPILPPRRGFICGLLLSFLAASYPPELYASIQAKGAQLDASDTQSRRRAPPRRLAQPSRLGGSPTAAAPGCARSGANCSRASTR